MDVVIWLPIVAGLILLVIPNLRAIKGIIGLLITAIVFYQLIMIYLAGSASIQISYLGRILDLDIDPMTLFRVDALSGLIGVFVGFFTLMVIIYTLRGRKDHLPQNYHPYLLMTLGASAGAIFADNLILFLIFWGFLAITLYLLIPSHDDESAAAANKSLIIIGGSDVIILVGIVLVWKIAGTLSMNELSIGTGSGIGILAFLTLLIGSFAKAGAFPFHSWIPDFAKSAPPASSAYLPASLDKLLGIYLMVRLCNEVFILNQWLTLAILIIGTSTIIIAVMMALVQHDYKKLLGYHAVSQVGYMVTGIGLGTVLGMVGGLFHMVNHALYKSGLFLVAGSIEHRTGESKIEKLGGLSRNMPVTFITALVFALAISGIPPFNGFASKWIIYQAIVDFGRGTGISNELWLIWLALAVIGSALTLASFVKFISGIFLGREKKELKDIRESGPLMWVPLAIIALLCVGFGIFATQYVVPFLFSPVLGEFQLVGLWSSSFISMLIIVSIVLGLLIYGLGTVRSFRKDDSFIGGENLQDSTGFEVTGFYNTIHDSKPLSGIYDKADKKWFDLYNIGKGGVLQFTSILKRVHSGLLQTYIIWFILGLVIMLIFLLLI